MRAATRSETRLELGKDLYDFVGGKYVDTLSPAEGIRGPEIDAIIESEYAPQTAASDGQRLLLPSSREYVRC